jgi:hypothetical protein
VHARVEDFMPSKLMLGAVALGCFAAGAVSAKLVFAQTSAPPAYLVGAVDVTDAETYKT